MADKESYPGTPRWVKVAGIVVIVVVVLVGIMLAAGLGGRHGPGRHLPSPGPEGLIERDAGSEARATSSGDSGGGEWATGDGASWH